GYEDLLRSSSASLAPRPTSPDDVCMQPYTSGSTGKPKGVLLTHGGQLWNAEVKRKALMLDHTERALVAVPLFHKNAMIGAVKPFLLAGGSIVILPGFDPLAVIRAIERYRVTYLTGVPAMYKMILAEREALERHDVSSIRYAVCGSAEVPEDLAEAFTSVFGAPLAESYGLTEGGPVPLCNTRWGLKKRGSCGTAFPGCEVKLVGADGVTEVGPNEVGELVTRNPGLAKGYWKLPHLTAERFRDGWLHTGDLFRRDEDGYFYFKGRGDDMINVAGENVYPKEVEDVLLRHPNVGDAYVVAAPHELKGEVPVAFVTERTRGAATEEEIKQFFLRHGAAHAHPRRVYFLDALPLNSTGKPDRNAMKKMAREVPA
ncbi:MAG: class I adenylate-forming enzyme family protein, partial [Gemmatimonadaceae bacterium]